MIDVLKLAVSKKITTVERAKKDELMVQEIVYPRYQQTCISDPANNIIGVYDDHGRRRSVDSLVRQLELLIK
jgi:hypothetical protein